MNILKRYMKNIILKTFFSIIFAFLVISIAMKFLGQMKHLGHGNYALYQVFQYVIFTQPRDIYIIFPFTLLLSISIVMLKLKLRNELVAIAACGIGIFDIIYIVFTTTLQIILICMLLGEVIAPYATNFAKNLRMTEMSGGNLATMKGQLWLHEGDSYNNIAKVKNDHTIIGITRYFVNNNGIFRIEHSDYGIYKEDHWDLHNIKWTDLNLKESNKSGFTKNKVWHSMLDPILLQNYDTKPSRQTLWSLFYTFFNAASIADNYDYLIFWQRLILPVVCLLMSFCVVVIFFNFEANITNNFKMMQAVSIILFFYFLKETLSSSLLNIGIYPLLIASLPLLFVLLLLLLLLKRYLRGNLIKRYTNRNE